MGLSAKWRVDSRTKVVVASEQYPPRTDVAKGALIVVKEKRIRRRGRETKKSQMQRQKRELKQSPTALAEPAPINWNYLYACWETENRPYLTPGINVGELGESIVELFMTDMNISEHVSAKVKPVESFCPRNTFKELQSGSTIMGAERIALLDDRSNDGKSSVARDHCGPLNVQRLYQELLKKRFPSTEDEFWEVQSGRKVQKNCRIVQPNADRRLIFITNLNRWALMALILTASDFQAWALRDSLYRHVEFKAFIGCNVAPQGFQVSQLAFDIPFFALRTASPEEKPHDTRILGARPLRSVHDLTFLSPNPADVKGSTELHYLCQAHVSLLIVAIDNERWVAYCFADTYFEQEALRESADRYHALMCNGNGSHPDPISGGLINSDPPILNPKQYFLAILDSRLKRVKDEWHGLVVWAETQIKRHIETSIKTELAVLKHKTRRDMPHHGDCRHWAAQSLALLSKLSAVLKATISNWQSVEASGKLKPPTAPYSRHLASIQVTVKDLEGYLQDLDNLHQVCERHNAMISLHLSQESTRDAKVQARASRSGFIMTLVMICLFSPTALAASILSMEPSAIPSPLRSNSASFFALATTLTVSIWIAVAAMLNWERIKPRRMFRYARREEDVERQ